MEAHIGRRQLLLSGCLGLLAFPLAAYAQPTRKAFRIGWPSAGTQHSPRFEAAFLRGMRDLGYVQGQNLILVTRCCAGGDLEGLNGFVDELVRMKVDVLLVSSPQAAVAAKKATTTIPIVFVAVANPIALGLVASLAKPGGNVTGVTHLAGAAGEMLSKHVELIKEIVPRGTRLAILIVPNNPIYQKVDIREVVSRLAQRSGTTIHILEARRADDLPGDFAQANRDGIQGLVVTADVLTFTERKTIADLAAQYRLPATYWFRESVEAGGLISYGTDFAELHRRAATLVDKVLTGTAPADIPVEQAAVFEMVVNMKTAKALRLAMPSTIQARVTGVVE